MGNRYLLIPAFMCVLPAIVYSQNQEQQISTFSSRMLNPVTVDVRNSDKDIIFTAENSSWYPYQLQIQFTDFVNLTPVISSYKTDIYHGKTVLFKLTVVDIGAFHDYAYNFQYLIGYANKKAMLGYLYAIPVGEGKQIKLSHTVLGRDTTFFRNVFMLDKGDTVYCMRKGIVTNILSTSDKFDRILKSGNIEIIHGDGTVATYTVPDEDHILVVPGQQVYPLQPLMILKKSADLTIQMCEINDTAVKSIPFTFDQETSDTGNLHGKAVKHSPVNPETELTAKEKKKLAKGELY
jgi:hypothetical protein